MLLSRQFGWYHLVVVVLASPGPDLAGTACQQFFVGHKRNTLRDTQRPPQLGEKHAQPSGLSLDSAEKVP